MQPAEEEKNVNEFNTSSNDFSKWNFDFNRFKINKIIGSGAYGTVCEGVNLKTGETVAIKRITNLFSYPIETKRVLREISILRRLNHPNIIKLYEVIIEGDPKNFNTIYMIMEYFPADIKRLFNSPIFLNHYQIEIILYQTLQALDYLHACNIMHRDIKPANILINDECQIKLCDFGLAVPFSQQEESNNNVVNDEKISFSPSNQLDKDFTLLQCFSQSAQTSPEKTNEKQATFNPDPKLSNDFSQKFEKKIAEIPFKLKGFEEENSEHIAKNHETHPIISHNNTVNMEPASSLQCFFKPLNKKDKKINKKHTLTKHVVSRWYRPPEIILIEPSYTTAVDIWSMGCVFAELLKMLKLNQAERIPLFPGTSCFPLSPEINKKDKRKLVIKGKKDQLKVILSVLGTPNEEDCDFIKDPNSLNYLKSFKKEEKLKFQEIFPASCAQAIDLLEKMLTFNPNERISAQEALKHGYFSKNAKKKVASPGINEKRDSISLKFDHLKNLRKAFLEEINFYKTLKNK